MAMNASTVQHALTFGGCQSGPCTGRLSRVLGVPSAGIVEQFFVSSERWAADVGANEFPALNVSEIVPVFLPDLTSVKRLMNLPPILNRFITAVLNSALPSKPGAGSGPVELVGIAARQAEVA